MADTILKVLENLLAAEAHIHVAGPEYVKARDAALAAIAALAAERPAPAEPVATLHVSDFRGYENYDFQHLVDLPPGHYKLFTACTAQPLAPAPAADGERDHVLGAGNMVPAAYAARLRQCPTHGQLPANAWGCPECLRELREELARLRATAADGEQEELAQWLERIGDDYDDLYRSPSALIRPKLARAAALLRQLPPDGLTSIRYCVEEDGAVIQRTSREPESWAIRAGSSCMSTTGEWDIEPMPSDRTDEWLTNHRWPSAAAAWAALQQARQQEVGDE